VGDSRIYLVRNRVIHQLTTDHTWIQEAIDKGILKPDQVPDHPNIHVIRRYLGSARPPEADLRLRMKGDESDKQAEANQGLLLLPGDWVLVCSDGLTDEIKNEEIRSTLAGSVLTKRRGGNIHAIAQSLIDLANRRGGHDNITVILMHLPKEPSIQLSNWLLIGLGVLAFLMVAAALVTVIYFIHPSFHW
jgi:protein phosphatase